MKVTTRTVKFHNRTVEVRMVGKTYTLRINANNRIERHKLLTRDQAMRHLGSKVMDVLDTGDDCPDVINVLPVQLNLE